MKVLLVGDVFGADRGGHFFMTKQKFLAGFVRNGHSVHVFNDRQEARYATIMHSRKFGRKPANRALVETARNYCPDLIFLGHCEIIGNDTLAEIRRLLPSVRIAYNNVDPIHDFKHDNHDRIMNRTTSVDAIFSTTAGEKLRKFAGRRAAVRHVPNPVDPSVEVLRQDEQPGDALPVDVFFAFMGRQSVRDPETGEDIRVAVAKRLKQRLPDVRFEIRGLDHPPVRGQAYLDAIARARMGVNLSRVSHHYLYSSDRMAHYAGCGLLTFVNRATGFGELFTEDELAFYDDEDELAERIQWFRDNDDARRRVAAAGRQRIHALFDVSRLARYVTEATFDIPYTDAYEWPTEQIGRAHV